MRYLKIIGLAAMAAAALMAVGAATSSATVFCKNNASTETCSEKYKTGTVGKGSSEGSLVLETTGGTTLDTCASGSVEKELGEEGSSTTTIKGPVEVSDIKLGECTKVTSVVSGGEGEVHWISGTDNGTVTGHGGEVTINTIFGTCTYGPGGGLDLGAVVGGKPASMSINQIIPKISGNFSCPAEARATGKVVLTSPSVGYVAAG